ncbi:MAG TPA: hypothetical protein VJZ00_05365 [Thermoanaerobaculia bacterium]|nr:hypothetical protein [Thermoanaerobaculia bacterium]
MSEKHHQNQGPPGGAGAPNNGWVDETVFEEPDPFCEPEGAAGPVPGPGWMPPWGWGPPPWKRRRDWCPPGYYPPRGYYRRRESSSVWWVFLWVFLGIILIAMLTPSVGYGVSTAGGGFAAIFGIVILGLAIWKVVDLIRGA